MVFVCIRAMCKITISEIAITPLKFYIVPDHALRIMDVVKSCNGAG